MNDELEKLKSLLYIGSLTQYGKRKLIKTYEDIIKEKDKQIDLMAEEIIMTKPANCTRTNEFNTEKVYMSKEEIKQYFTRIIRK